MDTLYLLDRLIHKPVRLTGNITPNLAPGSFVVYKDTDGTEMVGSILGYETSTEKNGTFLYPLMGQQEEYFKSYQEKAQRLYTIFKEEFGSAFPESVPITARMNLQGDQIYFYFYAEMRFNFSDFVKTFRDKIGCKFFLYQVGARDRVRLHPNLHERYDPCGLPLIYHIFRHPLPTVESEAISIQNLEGRNPDRLKDRSGKLDHTLNFEKDFYEQETKKYPPRGSIINRYGTSMKCMGFNILTQEIKLKTIVPADSHDDQKIVIERKKVTLHEFLESQKQSRPPAEKQETPLPEPSLPPVPHD